MCWSLQVSLGSWGVVLCLSAALWRRNWQTDRWYALLSFFVGQIQLCEAALWLDQQCSGLNQAAGKVLLGVIALEPLAHSVIALACTPPALRSRLQRVWPLAAAAFGVVWAVMAAPAPPTADASWWCSRPCGGGTCGRHLKWNWTVNMVAPWEAWNIAFLLFLVAPVATMRPTGHAVAGAAYGLATFAIAHVFFRSAAVFESMWCWMAVGGYSVPLLLCRPPRKPAQD